MCSIIEIRTPTEFTIRYETDDSLSGEHLQRTRNVKLISAARGSTVDTKGRKGVVRGRSVDPRGRSSEKTRTSSEATRGCSAGARGSLEKDGGWTENKEPPTLLPFGESNREADIVKNG